MQRPSSVLQATRPPQNHPQAAAAAEEARAARAAAEAAVLREARLAAELATCVRVFLACVCACARHLPHPSTLMLREAPTTMMLPPRCCAQPQIRRGYRALTQGRNAPRARAQSWHFAITRHVQRNAGRGHTHLTLTLA
jgi:hypothetical protein